IQIFTIVSKETFSFFRNLAVIEELSPISFSILKRVILSRSSVLKRGSYETIKKPPKLTFTKTKVNSSILIDYQNIPHLSIIYGIKIKKFQKFVPNHIATVSYISIKVKQANIKREEENN